MNQESHVPMAGTQESRGVEKGKLDMVFLRYMARRLHFTLLELDKPDHTRQTRPQVFKLQERKRRMHRAIIYGKGKLLTREPLTFVGWISARQRHVRPSIVQAFQRAEKQLVEELRDVPRVLSYSSLELRNGGGCHLVLLDNAGARMHMQSSETSIYVADDLAHSYYKWIRLHEGVMAEGLDHMEMQVQRTTYYTFQVGQQRPFIQELLHDTFYPGQPAGGSTIVPESRNTS